MCLAIAVLNLFCDGDKTIAFGRLFRSGIVLGKKMNLKDSVLHLYGKKEKQFVLVTECIGLR